MTKSRWGALVVALLLSLAVLPTVAQAEQCPNEQLRREDNSTGLPECRAYELVSPAFKNGAAVAMSQPVMAAASGERAEFGSTGVFAGAEGSPLGNGYVSAREASGWSAKAIEAAQANEGVILVSPTQGLSQDLGSTLVASLMALAPGAVAGQGNIYVKNVATGQYTLVASSPNPEAFAQFDSSINATYIGGAVDMSHAVFTFPFPLNADSFESTGVFWWLEGANIYDWAGGRLHTVNYLPDGSITHGATTPVSYEAGGNPHPVSADGSKTLFAAGGSLYDRENDTQTVLISESRRAGSMGEPEPGNFVGASADGSAVFFTSHADLLEGPVGPGELQLYRFNTETGALMSVVGDGTGLERIQQVSEGGSFVYFTAQAALAPGATPAPAGLTNSYVWHEGAPIKLVAQANVGGQVSPNGLHFAFSSSTQLTSYNCSGCTMLYEYDYETGQVRCASCNPDGSPPTAPVEVGGLPYGPGIDLYQPRYVTNDGMVVFGTRDALLPQDTNGVPDVYAWRDGRLSLLSTGTGSQEAAFADTSPDGRDVFIKTGQKLVGQDVDDNVDLYDVRVNGGFPAPPATVSCTGTGCQGVPSAPPIFATPPSETFNGVGNFEPPAKAPAAGKPKSLTKAQRLVATLKVCHRRKTRKQRAACEVKARKQYGKTSSTKSSTAKAKKNNGRGK